MYSGRLFTFGCSFTNYKWPTWADLLGRQFEKHHAYGKIGGGNLFIACSVAEAIAKHKINQEDTVLIMWSNVMREDRYTNKWITPGNIFTQTVYSEKFIKEYITIRGCYIRDIAQIFLVDRTLERTGCKYEFMSMVDFINYEQYTHLDATDKIKDVLTLYKETIDKIKPSVHNIIFNYDWGTRPLHSRKSLRADAHPLPLEHIEYIKKVLPEYEFDIDTINYAEEIEKKIRKSFLETDNYEHDFIKSENRL